MEPSMTVPMNNKCVVPLQGQTIVGCLIAFIFLFFFFGCGTECHQPLDGSASEGDDAVLILASRCIPKSRVYARQHLLLRKVG